MINDQINEVCQQIIAEQNSRNFLALVTRLKKFLREKQEKLEKNASRAA
ncbi:MAG: hypothetical protein JWO91_3079 [Acidobacteriaceae bacterium]|nr:hypothetical protein [Acidobacteriaceae bacterium]